jgi:transcription-repair coupling factor (superfamily II helicase)
MLQIEDLARLNRPRRLTGAPFGADIRVLVEAGKRRGGVIAYVARDERQAQAARDLAGFFDPTLETCLLPAWDNLPYDRVSPSPESAAQRCAGLVRLALTKPGETLFVALTATALIQRAAPIETMRKSGLMARVGGKVPPGTIETYLQTNGFVRSANVREPGEFAVRGGITDVYPPGAEEPVRLDLFGDVLDGLRTFDPETQRTTGKLTQVQLSPVSEILFTDEALSRFRLAYFDAFGAPQGDPMFDAARARIRRQGLEHWLPLFHEQLANVTDYLGPDALIAFDGLARDAIKERLEQAEDYYRARIDAAGEAPSKVLAPSRLYLPLEELDAALQTRACLQLSAFREGDDLAALSADGVQGREFAPERLLPDVNVFDEVAAYARERAGAGQAVVFSGWTAGSTERLRAVLSDHGLEGISPISRAEDAVTGRFSLVALPLEHGFEQGRLTVITEQDMLGDKLARPRRKRRGASFIAEAAALSVGDLVVHIEHGIARYVGLRTVDVMDAPHDCLELVYSGGDKLLLPVENIELVSRYGSDNAEAELDRLGGASWQGRKAKARKRIFDMAEELIQIAAARLVRVADKAIPAEGLFEEFCSRFPHEETDDQLSAIEDTVADLASGRPMDRLVCGDVGFGKTEVALRAAFVAAMSGMQVAVIAPTTLLARQHFKTFSERFAPWPLKVRHLSRLVPAKEATQAREGVEDGTVDIIVGTHAVLSSQVNFKRMGLLIVDEEQRFGVKHKERLKELKSDVHVLTLSATPIPRTLQLSLTGIRDLSIIATPPVDRLSVRTYVTEFDPISIREALLRERYRGGQAFFVAPRIQDLPKLEHFLRTEVPEVSFIAAHGQMAPTELEDIMSAFYDGKYDVLLSTTIVESGLDIPRANTLVIYRADMFGLAQLYQLRGRVGRSKLRAYAYFTTPEDMSLTPGAEKRLKILQSLDSLGAGFMLASHDLDMRGGGNLLGDQQSGHIKEVGVELYQSMLSDAVKVLKEGGEVVLEGWSPSINLGAAVLIPESYVDDLTVRMSLYRKLAGLETEPEREAFAAELIDRFGPLPSETQQLLQVSGIKAACKRLGIAKLDSGPKGAVLTFRNDTPVQPGSLIALIQRRPALLKLRPDGKLVAAGHWPEPQQRLDASRRLLAEIEDLLLTN